MVTIRRINTIFFLFTFGDHLQEYIVFTASAMARGHQKFQSQQKNAKKQADIKKSKGHDQKAAAKAALVYTCAVCRTQMPDPKTFKQHFESKHPKSPMPPELEGVEA
ncbi:zinc finger protein 706-like [Halichoeres trimaculatus]|uniref:zinc finger protein 706-like n=1 Tax=Halichoeres trimaculatus TaxID=147232 RepID=UPI003D9F0B84